MDVPHEFRHLLNEENIPWKEILDRATSYENENEFVAFTDAAIARAREECVKETPERGTLLLGAEAALTRGRLAEVLFLTEGSKDVALLGLRAIALFALSDVEGLDAVLRTMEEIVTDDSPVADRVRVCTVRVLLAAVKRDASVIMCVMEFDNLLDSYPEQLDDPLTETMFTLYVVGTMLREVGEIKKAERLTDTLESLAKSRNHRMIRGLVEHLRGNICYFVGDIKGAEEHYLRFKEISKELDFRLGVGMALNNLGSAMIYTFRLEEALDCLNQALEYMDTDNSRQITLLNLGEISMLLGQYDEAEDYFKKAIRLEKKVGKGVIETYTLPCALYVRQGRLRKAKNMLTQAKTIADASESPVKKCAYLQAEALVVSAQGQYEEAIKILEQMMAFAKKNGIFEMVVRAEIELARTSAKAYEQTGNDEMVSRAMSHLDDVTQIAKEQGMQALRAQALMLKGDLMALTGNLVQAKGYLERARTIAKFRDDAALESQIAERLEILDSADGEGMEAALDASMERISAFRSKGPFKVVPVPTLHAIIAISRHSGLTEFVHYFDRSLEMDSTIVAGFISAVSAFSRQLMGSTGNLRSISHEGFTLMMEHTHNHTVALIATEESFELRYRLREFAREFDSKFPSPKDNEGIDPSVYSSATEIVKRIFPENIVGT